MESKAKWIVIALVGIAVLLAVLFLIRGVVSLVGNGAKNTSKTTVSKVVPVTKITVAASNVVKDPLVYDGLTVEIDAPVSDWITKKVFALSAGKSTMLFGTSNGQLIVASKNEFPLHTKSDQKGLGLGEIGNVHVVGRVRIVSREEFKSATGIDLDGEDIKLDDNRISSWKEAPIILLDSVEKL